MTTPDKIWLGCMTEDFEGATLTMDGWSAYPELKEGTWLEGPHEYTRTSAHPVTVEMLERVEHAFSHWKDGYSADSARSVTADLRAAIAAMKEQP